ncbi:MAG TPA: nitrogenase component 1, partial [Acidobacteriota bacterium]|nr:nitrogenase component 1 [Acidobacteriota bacterium]
MERDDTACTLRRFLEDRFSLQFLSAPPPVGLKQTEDWINQIALAYGREKRAKRLISEISASYSRRLETLRPVLKGKRVLIFTYLQELDWLLETILDLGMNVEKLCLYNSCIKQAFSSRLSEIPAEINYSASRRDHDIEECRPDLVLSNYLPSRMIQGINYAVVPLCPRLGWSTGLDHAELWARNSLIPFVEGWRHDQKLFSTLS